MVTAATVSLLSLFFRLLAWLFRRARLWNPLLISKTNWKSRLWVVGKTDEQNFRDFKICDPSIQSWYSKSNSLPIVIIIIIITVTPVVIFLSSGHPTQIAFAGVAWGRIRKEQYLSLFSHKYIFLQWHYQPPRELVFTPSWEIPPPSYAKDRLIRKFSMCVHFRMLRVPSCASARANEITAAERTQFGSQIEWNGCFSERRRHIGRRFFSLSCATMKWELFSPTVES